MFDKDSLKNLNVIITGGSSGIGKGLAFELSKYGAFVGLISRSEDKMKKIIDEITKEGGMATYAVADVSDYEQISSGIKKLINEMKRIDIIYSNAGIFRRKSFKKFRVEQIDSLIDINLKGALYTTHAILPHFLENGKGSIIFTSSISSQNPTAGTGIYSASKAGVNSFTIGLAEELKSNKINVNAVLPGFIDTPMMRYGITEEQVQALNPLTVDEVLPYFTFFVSKKARKETGNLLNVQVFRENLTKIKELPNDIPRKWSNLKDILKEKLDYSSYKNIKQNKKFLSWILKHNESLR